MGEVPRRGDAEGVTPCHHQRMAQGELAARLDLLEAALGAVMHVLPADVAQDVRAALADHLQQLGPLPDDLDAVLGGAVARLIGLV